MALCISRLFMEGNFNFERMQGEALHSPSSQPYAKFMVITNAICNCTEKSLQFFNASPKLFTFLLGTAVAMEENKEKPSTVNVMKVAGMGPTGGIGDAIDHMTLMPLTLALGASIAMEGSFPAHLFSSFVPNCSLFVYFGLMFMGYRAGTAAMVNMSDAKKKLAKAANIMGIL